LHTVAINILRRAHVFNVLGCLYSVKYADFELYGAYDRYDRIDKSVFGDFVYYVKKTKSEDGNVPGYVDDIGVFRDSRCCGENGGGDAESELTGSTK